MEVPMASPVYLDGPLDGLEHPVSDDVIEQGMYRYADVIYTWTLVRFMDRDILVGSTGSGIPSPDLLFAKLTTQAAQNAVRS
jgi:hypothetical protein